MKPKYKITRIQEDAKEVYDMDGYYQVLHFIIDLFVFGFSGSVIIKIEKIEDEKLEEETK